MRKLDSCLRHQSSRHTAILLESNQKCGVIFPRDTGIVVLPTENFILPSLSYSSSSSSFFFLCLSLSQLLCQTLSIVSLNISLSLLISVSLNRPLFLNFLISLSISLFLSCINLSKTSFRGCSWQCDSSGRSRSHFLSLF